MGLFKVNYAKPGRGISKEEAQKRGYFKILKRKFWKISQLSLVYSLCNGIFFIAFLIAVMPFFYSPNIGETLKISEYIYDIFKGRAMLPVSLFVPFMLVGPGNAAISYITRNFARQEPVFIWSDFWRQFKINFKQGICFSVISALVYYLYFTAFIYYINSLPYKILVIVLGANIGFILFTAPFYIYTIMVTYDMKLRHIIKNACIISLANLKKTVLLFVSLYAVHTVLIICVLPIWLTLMPVFLFGWSFYTISYVSLEAMEKYMGGNPLTQAHRKTLI